MQALEPRARRGMGRDERRRRALQRMGWVTADVWGAPLKGVSVSWLCQWLLLGTPTGKQVGFLEEDRLPGRGGSPGRASCWLPGMPRLQQAEGLPAFTRARLQTAAARTGVGSDVDKVGCGACRGTGLSLVWAPPLPTGDQGEPGKTVPPRRPGQAQGQLKSTCFPVSAGATTPPLRPAVPEPQTQTTALFTSTPLLLCELMGYSAALVPFSSFLSGFLTHACELQKR